MKKNRNSRSVYNVLLESIIVVIILLLSNVSSYAEDDCNRCFNTPWKHAITSDFGPRNIQGGTWFHKGIDYGMPANTPLLPIENGVIVDIDFLESTGWYVNIKSNSDSRTWQYLHTFNGVADSLPRYSCSSGDCSSYEAKEWELVEAELILPSNSNNIKKRIVIIKWAGNFAEKVFCAEEDSDRYIRIENVYLMSNATTRAETQSSVVVGKSFAPSGNSGRSRSGSVYPEHLHLGVNEGKDNPLRYLKSLS